MEDLLVGALDDDERRIAWSATWGGKPLNDLRIGDLAGHVLWMRWPKKYPFDIAASAAVRDRQQVELRTLGETARAAAARIAPRSANSAYGRARAKAALGCGSPRRRRGPSHGHEPP